MIKKESEHPAKRPTLRDVARAAHCSVTAASYAITHSRSLSRELSGRILAAADRLGYRPYAMRRGKARPWVICLSVTQRHTTILAALRHAFLERGYFMAVLFFDHHDPLSGNGAEQLAALNKFRQVAGILNLHPTIQSLDLLRCGRELPSVILSREDSMLSEVVIPFHLYGELAARQLCRIGHPKAALLMLMGNCNYEILERQVAGLLEHTPLAANGIRIEIRRMENLEHSSLETEMDALYRSGVTAFVIWNPDLALAVELWAYRRRIRIPQEISCFVYDPSGCMTFMPPLSSIVPPEERLAELTAESLCAKIERRPFEHCTVEPLWIERGSTLPFAETGKA